jgi:hypothetical protein
MTASATAPTPPWTKVMSAPELRAALSAITRHVDDYAHRAPTARRAKLDTNVHKLTTKIVKRQAAMPWCPAFQVIKAS